MKPGVKKALKITGITIGSLLGTVVLLAGTFILALTAREWKPADEEILEIHNPQTQKVELGKDYNILSWNIGYCALGKDEDFFMDGGTRTRAHNAEEVNNNIYGVTSTTSNKHPDFIFYQETDLCSHRSMKIDEVNQFRSVFNTFNSTFAFNYNCDYVPFPIPTLGKVQSGLLTLSRYGISSAMRKSLPVPFKWPLRIANLKRCLNISRLPIQGSDKELVLINLHLEAYDDGEGKIAQTKLLLEILSKEYEAGNYVIAGGDFNQCFSNLDQSKYPVADGLWKPGLIDINDFTSIHYQPCVSDLVPSCRLLNHPLDVDKSKNTYYVIDGFFCSDNIIVNSFETLDCGFVNSDHNPTFASFKLA